MNQLGFLPDVRITDRINKSEFTLSAEIIPPRNGVEQQTVLRQIDSLIRSKCEFMSVTKGAGGSLRGGSLPIAQTIKENFKVPCIAHFTCRDITPEEVENQLMDHHYFGIRNILALRGDPPNNQPDWVPREGSYKFAYQLIEQISNLNKGIYIDRKGGRASGANPEPTDFCIGCAVYPEHAIETERLEFFKNKIDAGAEYAITQMLFDVDAYKRFMDLCDRNQLYTPVIPGTRILKSQGQARRMADRFEVSVPESYIEKLPEKYSPDCENQVLDLFTDFVDQLKSAGAPGVHLFVLSDTELACGALRRLAKE